MPTNVYINNFESSSEQSLIESLIIESIKFYGRDFYYIPRKQSGSFDQIYGEDPRKSFEEAHLIEMYIKNVEGFEGEGDLLGRFGLEIRDQTTLTVAIRRFEELLVGNSGLSAMGLTRPREGDLIFMDFVRPDPKYPGKAGMFFEIQFVEHEAMFYQTGSLQTYDLRCESFTYSNETFETGVDAIDAAFANGVSSYVTTGNTMPNSTTADNFKIEAEAESILDLSETSPFGDFG